MAVPMTRLYQPSHMENCKLRALSIVCRLNFVGQRTVEKSYFFPLRYYLRPSQSILFALQGAILNFRKIVIFIWTTFSLDMQIIHLFYNIWNHQQNLFVVGSKIPCAKAQKCSVVAFRYCHMVTLVTVYGALAAPLHRGRVAQLVRASCQGHGGRRFESFPGHLWARFFHLKKA